MSNSSQPYGLTVTHQAPLSTGFSRQEYWSGLSFPPPGGLPHPGTEPISPPFWGIFFTAEPPGKHVLPFKRKERWLWGKQWGQGVCRGPQRVTPWARSWELWATEDYSRALKTNGICLVWFQNWLEPRNPFFLPVSLILNGNVWNCYVMPAPRCVLGTDTLFSSSRSAEGEGSYPSMSVP